MAETLKLKDVTPIDDQILEAFDSDDGMRLALRAVYKLGRQHHAAGIPVPWEGGDTRG